MMIELKSGNTQKVWLLAAICGLVSFLALLIVAQYSTGSSIIVGVLVAVLAAILLWVAWYEEEGDVVSSQTDGVETSNSVQDHYVENVSQVHLKAEEASANVQPDKTLDDAVSVSQAGVIASKPKRAPIAKDGKPILLDAARAEGADDLKQLKGVGPKLEARLNALGLYHFDQVAGLRKKEVDWVDKTLDAKGRIMRDDWVAQAKVLVKGGETEFSKRVKKGGVY